MNQNESYYGLLFSCSSYLTIILCYDPKCSQQIQLQGWFINNISCLNRWFWLFCEQIDIRNEESMGVVKFTQVCPGLCKILKVPPKLLDAFCIVQNTLYSEKYFESAKRVWNYFFILFLLVNQIAVVSPELIGGCFWLWACR